VTAFERRRQIVNLLRERPGIRVTQLAELLDVSQGTIRSDLTELEDAGHLRRLRGGAVLRHDHRFLSPPFAAHLQVNADAKQWIARRASSMIEDGDSILLDASTTVFGMVPHLRSCHNLTVVTNGIEIGLAQAQDRSHTVIVAGRTIHPDCTSVVGHLGEKILEGPHVKTAFVSCSRFSVEAGLTEADIQEIQIKRKMVRCAERVVALIDSSKFGRVNLTSFADLGHISHLLTDRGVDPSFVEQVRQTKTILTSCGESPASSLSRRGKKNHHGSAPSSTAPTGSGS
jgi:DeoR family fructose operon transcriptional repressor